MLLVLRFQFEKTADHIFEAAYHGQKDAILGFYQFSLLHFWFSWTEKRSRLNKIKMACKMTAILNFCSFRGVLIS